MGPGGQLTAATRLVCADVYEHPASFVALTVNV
jgi:hypothetical protein